MTRAHYVLVFVILGLVSGCRKILSIQEATLICPPEQPDCKFCSKAADCGRSTECHVWACEDSLCMSIDAPPRKTCSLGVCSETSPSECVVCVENADCPNGGHCGDDHACYRCDDGEQNGLEKGIDCGGPCKRCLGEFCAGPDECKSGSCVDGHCCNSPCDQACASCSNDEGNCTALPKYASDSEPACDGNNACDGSGTCLAAPGAFCVSDIDCASYRCMNNRCAKQAGETCASPDECVDDACASGVCKM